jgi:thiol-disulfide isomerase/thioredoxin
MRERRSIAGTAVVLILLAAVVGPALNARAGTRGYFACPVLVFFGTCPILEDARDEAATGPERPPRSSAGQTGAGPPPVESPWAEPRSGIEAGGQVYVPPRPVREFLEAPTPERARAYLTWNQERLRAIGRAAEVLRLVTASETGIGDRSAEAATRGPTAGCAVPAASVDGATPTTGDEGPLPGLLVAPADSQRTSHRITVIYAFASWCPYSAHQTPLMVVWARSRPDVPVTALLFDSPPGAATQFNGLPFPVHAGSRALRERLSIQSYPTILVVKDGVVVERLAGPTPATRLEEVTRALGT